MLSMILTEFGDEMVPCIGIGYHVLNDIDLAARPNFRIGSHSICGGYINVKWISKTHAALLCEACSLRLVFPRVQPRTWDELRMFFIAHPGGLISTQQKIEDPDWF